MSIDAISRAVATTKSGDLNEADTRFRIIDELIITGLGWPKSSVSLEQSTVEGYADYHLKKPNGDSAIVVEAKRAGVDFVLPANFNAGKTFRRVKVRALLSGKVGEALIQAQRYASDFGCEYCVITNGRQFVLFKAFEKNKMWRDLGAYVISDISWFQDNYSDAVNILGYSSVTDRNSLYSLFRGSAADGRELFFPKERINAYSQILNQNMLAPSLRPVAKKYFGRLVESDPAFITSCYVSERAYDKNLRGVRSLIRDSVTPFFESYGVKETQENVRGGAIGKRIEVGAKGRSSGDVIVLFGGKGSGKSTFLWKVLHHNPPQVIKKHAAIATLDMLAVPKDERSIHSAIWTELVKALDTTKILEGEREGLINLFADQWGIACKQDFVGLDPSGEAYNSLANLRLREWKTDLKYVSQRLALWHRAMHRNVVVVLDNTDQFENDLQDYSFTVAQEISSHLSCLVLISMREERFYASKIRGLLDAYQNSSFHISSPSADDVFIKRLEYSLQELRSNRMDVDADDREKIGAFLRVFLSDFRLDPSSPLNLFISACAHGNIRLALELFVELMLSGYTNAREMIESRTGWNILIHQVLRPLMSPTRLFYDEKLSKVPNIFQIRSVAEGSHFSGLRILRLLSDGQDPLSPSFIALGDLKNRFVGLYGHEDDFRHWLDAMLSSNLAEASTRQDSYSEEIDAVKVTAFGRFVLEDLSSYFTYLEMVSTDCGVRSESVCNELAKLANEEVAMMSAGDRFERVKRRLSKADVFVTYLAEEEARELEFLGLGASENFMSEVRRRFDLEQPVVLRSASRNRRRRPT